MTQYECVGDSFLRIAWTVLEKALVSTSDASRIRISAHLGHDVTPTKHCARFSTESVPATFFEVEQLIPELRVVGSFLRLCTITITPALIRMHADGFIRLFYTSRLSKTKQCFVMIS